MKSTWVLFSLAILITTACSDGSKHSSVNTHVYDNRMLVACDYSGNITIEQSSQALRALGAIPISSSCAQLVNISFTESCSDLTGHFYIHEVSPSNLHNLSGSNYIELSKLPEHEFHERYTISEEGLDYFAVDCE